MPLLLLLLLSLTHLQHQWNSADWLGLDAFGSLVVTGAGILALWLASFLGAWYFRRRLLLEPGQRTLWMRRFSSWKRYHFCALLSFYLVALYLLGWGWTIRDTFTRTPWAQPVMELAMLAPMFLGLAACWTHNYDLERVAHHVVLFPENQPFLGRWSYVSLQARHNLLLIVPPLFLMILEHVLFGFFPDLEGNSSVMVFLVSGLLVTTFLCIPVLLRWFLGLVPLPPGPLRSRLEACARKLRLRYSDILLWNTRSTVANAMVTGVLPWLRYVIVSDRLVENLSEEEVEAVFGHEVGHIEHHHMLFYLLFLMTSLVALDLLWSGAIALAKSCFPDNQEWAETFQLHSVLPQLLLFAVYMVVVFGFLSRRCERQADIFGCRVASTGAFISALEKVADLNGIPRERPGLLSSWQHGSIAQRVDFLKRMQIESALEENFQRRLGIIKWGVALGLGGLAITGCVILGPERVGEIFNSGTPAQAAHERG